MVDMEKDMTEALQTFTLGLETLKVYEVMRSQLNNVLDLLLPGDGHTFTPSAARTGPPSRTRSPGGWRTNCRGWRTGAVLRQTFGSGAGRVDVEVEHLLDDYWWVTATRAGTHPDDAAMAVVRIRDSKDRLRYGAGYSARIS